MRASQHRGGGGDSSKVAAAASTPSSAIAAESTLLLGARESAQSALRADSDTDNLAVTLARAVERRAASWHLLAPPYPRTRRLARLKWAPTDTITEASLSSELQAALTLARAQPDALVTLPG